MRSTSTHPRRRELSRLQLGLLGALALGGAIAMAWSHTWQVKIDDYGAEAMGPLTALLHGHLTTFLRTAPSYGPSLELRAPFALLASLAHGTELLVYRFSALPCLFALGALGVWIAPRLRAAGRGWFAILLTVAICVANPVTYYAMAIGHPEEVLGAVLCVAAVIVAQRGNAVWAGVLLGLAIANKEWGLVAIGPVLLALPGGRLRALGAAVGVCAITLGPLAIASHSISVASSRITVNDSSSYFYPQQIWWFFGTPGHWLPSMRGELMPGFRLPPSWLQGRAHLLIVWIGLPLTLLAVHRRLPREHALALLALLLLLRCMLDPWDLIYYPLPFIVALLCWETLACRRAPLGALVATVATWLIFEVVPLYVSANGRALAFAIPSVLALVALCTVVYRRRAGTPAAQSTTSSSLVNWLSRRAPSPLNTTRSSIRTPSAPGR
jgi:hypothetical protein